MLLRLAPLALMLSIGCPSQPPTPTPAPAPAPAPKLPSRVLQPEPPGIVAGGVALPATPSGKSAWTVDAENTLITFLIVSNSAGGITGRFPVGASGALDATTKKGVFHVDLATLTTVNPTQQKEPLRDQNVVEAFFGARPLTNEKLRASLDLAWQKLEGKLKRGVGRASFVVDGIDGPAADPPAGAPGAMVKGTVRGTLVLWESVRIPVTVAVAAQRNGDVVQVASADPIAFNLDKVLGSALRDAAFATLLAAGCAHDAGVQSDVAIVLEKVTLKAGGG